MTTVLDESLKRTIPAKQTGDKVFTCGASVTRRWWTHNGADRPIGTGLGIGRKKGNYDAIS